MILRATYSWPITYKYVFITGGSIDKHVEPLSLKRLQDVEWPSTFTIKGNWYLIRNFCEECMDVLSKWITSFDISGMYTLRISREFSFFQYWRVPFCSRWGQKSSIGLYKNNKSSVWMVKFMFLFWHWVCVQMLSKSAKKKNKAMKLIPENGFQRRI